MGKKKKAKAKAKAKAQAKAMAKAKAEKAAKRAAKRPARKTMAGKAAKSSQPSAKKTFLDVFSREHATTLKVLRALPAEQQDFRPHPAAKAARELAWVFVLGQMLISKALTDTLTLSGKAPSAPDDIREVAAELEKGFASTVELIRKTPDGKFGATTVKFPVGPGQMGDWTKLDFAWYILHDQIHHRGQLSVYVRMAGGKVPSIYGPSSDEPWF